ncbi:MAG TPA: hypothetical protein VN852_11475, partial [Candidatus Krumholzibacteria bacterium]|nr:hypothetical protein [Candidatus Krumholzibacteria bacterium]
RVLLPSNAATARLVSRLRLAEEAVETARMARRIVTVALIEDETLRMDAELPAHMWTIRDGLGVLVTCGDLPAVDSRLAGACRVGASMTFSGAVRSAAARLVEQKNRVRTLAPVSKEE